MAPAPGAASADWTLARGEAGLSLGPPGAGKTLLLEVCALLRRPASGRVQVLGEDPAGLSPADRAALRRRIGWAPQTPAFLEHLSLIENLAAPLRLAGVGPKDRAAQAAEVLDWLGLAHRADAPPARLSLGERRRAALARAVIAGPELVLADEPFAGLDETGAALAGQMLRTLAEHGAAVVVASADPSAARRLGGRAAALVLAGPPAASPSAAASAA
ncbi:MAG: ATP-binding cassette domain-containing protein [Pseudomonadota bacterium]